jgi:hypothetical protein
MIDLLLRPVGPGAAPSSRWVVPRAALRGMAGAALWISIPLHRCPEAEISRQRMPAGSKLRDPFRKSLWPMAAVRERVLFQSVQSLARIRSLRAGRLPDRAGGGHCAHRAARLRSINPTQSSKFRALRGFGIVRNPYAGRSVGAGRNAKGRVVVNPPAFGYPGPTTASPK